MHTRSLAHTHAHMCMRVCRNLCHVECTNRCLMPALSEISRPFKNNGNVIVKNGFFMADRHLKFSKDNK